MLSPCYLSFLSSFIAYKPVVAEKENGQKRDGRTDARGVYILPRCSSVIILWMIIIIVKITELCIYILPLELSFPISEANRIQNLKNNEDN